MGNSETPQTSQNSETEILTTSEVKSPLLPNPITIKECVICGLYESPNDKFVNPCKCKGSITYHESCLKQYIIKTKHEVCQTCHSGFRIKKLNGDVEYYKDCLKCVGSSMFYFLLFILTSICYSIPILCVMYLFTSQTDCIKIVGFICWNSDRRFAFIMCDLFISLMSMIVYTKEKPNVLLYLLSCLTAHIPVVLFLSISSLCWHMRKTRAEYRWKYNGEIRFI